MAGKQRKGGQRTDVDWEAVERDFRATTLTYQQLADKYGVDKSSVFRRAKSCKWDRDLTQHVKSATRVAIVAQAAKEAAKAIEQDPDSILAEALMPAPEQKRLFGPTVRELAAEAIEQADGQAAEDMAQTVRLAAATNISVILGHRRDLSSLRTIAQSMMVELAQASANADQLAAFAEIAATAKFQHIEDDEERDRLSAKALEAFLRMTELPNRAGVLQKLADVVGKVITHERTAFGLDDEEKSGSGMEDALKAALEE